MDEVLIAETEGRAQRLKAALAEMNTEMACIYLHSISARPRFVALFKELVTNSQVMLDNVGRLIEHANEISEMLDMTHDYVDFQYDESGSFCVPKPALDPLTGLPLESSK